MYMNRARDRETDVTALIDMESAMYTSGMAEAPDVEKDLAIYKARNQLSDVIEKARYFDGVTYLLFRGKRVAVVAPAELGEIAEAYGGPAALVEYLRSQPKPES